ncbi:hypothetical protein TSAR_014879 [Trichomalopsis sarcophagae]|uniref:Uncharacterized protein n=1 Tax=Trichomalopsis sarcophagae TaxID=543379 RepID=A0A232EDQ6_9HYME|nr:hypothetical protein TSAR_014879 [Trichomalopsis sarcophagae]
MLPTSYACLSLIASAQENLGFSSPRCLSNYRVYPPEGEEKKYSVLNSHPHARSTEAQNNDSMLSLHGSRSGQHAPNKLRLSKPNRVRAGKSRLFLAPLSLQLPGVSTRGRGKEILSTQVATYTTRPTHHFA